jgi:hypothetical protein
LNEHQKLAIELLRDMESYHLNASQNVEIDKHAENMHGIFDSKQLIIEWHLDKAKEMQDAITWIESIEGGNNDTIWATEQQDLWHWACRSPLPVRINASSLATKTVPAWATDSWLDHWSSLPEGKMTKTVTVNCAGIEFTVTGEYVPYVPENFLDPAEGGGFEDYSVCIGNDDLTELLSGDVLQYIIKLADEAASEWKVAEYNRLDGLATSETCPRFSGDTESQSAYGAHW